MKIAQSSKKAASPPPQVAELMNRLLNTPTDELPQVLAEIDAWKWPRSDLNSWTKVLNKFDSVLEEIIRDYQLDKLQMNVFTPITKKTVCAILRFERLLLENSTNRKMFNSYDRLHSLLFSSDLDVVILALNVLLRPAQQYSAQPSVSQSLSISTQRLQSLAKRWPSLREYGLGLVDLSSPKGSPEVNALPIEAREVVFSFYKTDAGSDCDKEKNMETDALGTPSSSARKVPVQPTPSGSGAINIHLDEETLASKSVMDVLADTIEAYSVPDDEKFELMCRIRAAKLLASGQESDRVKLVIIRLLAIAIFGHTHPESEAATSLFLYEPDLIAHIAELLQIDKGVPVRVQTTAISALDSLAHYRSRNQEVLTAVNAGVNHGILMALVRRTVADVADPASTLPQSFIEALMSFVTFISTHASGGNMVVGAGLIPLLIQMIDNKLPNRLPVVSKTMQLVDNVLYSFTNAFNIFCTSHGIEALVNRIEYEVDIDIKDFGGLNHGGNLYELQGDLPIARSAVLKHILRSMHRMMQSSGTAEGLRGLIDLSLLQSIKKIIQHRSTFGPNVLPLAINIMATFVHNEPTSLAIIQEAGLPEAFYKAIEAGLEPSIEVLQAIPNALGALCLNDVGQTQLARRPSIIPGILSVFTSERHLKVLLDKENSVLLGTAIDELIRHHPSLRTPVFDALKATIAKIEELGIAYEVPEDLRHWYRLVPGPISTDGDVAMEGVESAASTSRSDVTLQVEDTQTDILEDDVDEATNKNQGNHIVSFIDVLGRFLEGLFQHTPHCKDFITHADGLARLGRLTSLPCLPYDFANSVASDSMVQVMRAMTEVSTNETFHHLAQLVKESLEDTRSFWEAAEENSKLLPLVDITGEQEEAANQFFRSLITLHIRITLLSDVFATAGYAHGRSAIGFLQSLMNNMSPQVIADLGSLHRVGVWENIVLNLGLQSKGISLKRPPTLGRRSAHWLSMNLPGDDSSINPNELNGDINPPDSSEPTIALPNVPAKLDGRRERNSAGLKHLTHGLLSCLAPFFQAMVKMFHARRHPDSAQKKQINESSEILGKVMVQHLSPKTFHDVPSVFAYYTVILGLYSTMLADERTSSHSIHTVQLLALYRAGGIDAILEVCRAFMRTIETVTAITTEERNEAQKKELSHAFGGLRVALHLIRPIITAKPLLESGQTPLLATPDKKDTDPDYFEAHNFLVKLRVAILPLLRDLWQAPWLISAPLYVSKSVVQVVLEVTNEEGEDRGAPPNIEGVSAPNNGPSRRPGPDEAQVQTLIDMGFPRSAAERALSRTGNNLSAATEILLSHPFPLPPDPDPELETTTTEPSLQEHVANADGAEVGLVQMEDVAPTPGEGMISEEPPPPSAEIPVVVGKSAEQWRKELDEAREPLRAGLSRQALLLIDEHVSLLFDLRAVFLRPNNAHLKQAIQELVDDIKAFSPFAYDVQEQPLANRCRLIALVLSESPSLFNQETRFTLMDSLLALLLSSIDPEHPPRWLATHLLVTEALFTLAAEPRAIAVPKEGEPIVAEAITVGPPLKGAKAIVFDFCLRLLAVSDLPTDEWLSILRLFVLLTRDYDMALQFMKSDGLSMLLRRVKASAVPGSSTYIAIILRHIVEDPVTLRNIMQHTIKRYFEQPRTRSVDVGTYVRSCNSMALRNPDVFLEVTESLCQLGDPYLSPHISLKAHSPVADEQPTQKIEAEGTSDMQIDEPSTLIPGGAVESMIFQLINELMSTMKMIAEIPPRTAAEGPLSRQPTSNAGPTDDIASDVGDSAVPTSSTVFYDYGCFLMQCLTELLFSYDSCKFAFLSYSPKKRGQTPSKETGSKYRTATLHFLLSDLVTFGTINPQPDERARNRITLCNWAMSVLVALCVDSAPNHEVKEVSADLVSVRKFVLEAVSRAIKDLPPSDNLEARYGRLLALADLCHRLLIVRFNATSNKQQDENPTHIAKVMLEKNFVATLTTALSEIDLNYPHVRGLVPSVLRPLQYLTKIAIKMSRSSAKSSKDAAEGAKAQSAPSSDSEDEDLEDTGREETPDLYRNSALGMYGGEMDDAHFGRDEDMDGDEEDEDDDVEMDFGEDTASDATSDTEDDGEEDNETHESTDAWDEGDDEDDDLIENDDEEGLDDGEDRAIPDEGDDDDGEEDVMWQDVRGEIDGVRLGDDDMDDDDDDGHAVPIQIIHEDDEEPEDVGSDEEDYVLGDGGPSEEQVFGFGDAFVNANNREGAGVFVHRRRGGNVDDGVVEVFGRSGNNPATPPEATTHPLLLDTSTSSNRSASNQPRVPRQIQRVPGNGTAELLQTIDDLMGGGAIQLFQQLMTRGRGGGPESIRLDVPAGAVVNLERAYVGQRRHGVYAASVRVERAPTPHDDRTGRELEPIPTSQRWVQEARVLHGEFVTERLNKFTNRVILALLPAAVEAFKQAQIQEEREKAIRQEALAKEEAEAAEKIKADQAAKEEADQAVMREAEVAVARQADLVSNLVPTSEDQAMEDAIPLPAAADSDMTDVTAPEPVDAELHHESTTESLETPGESSSAPTAPPERVTVMIHGSPVDITETGIDPTFLEALPDDMREEVLNQHVRDQRAARIERPPDSQISNEFLEALPPEIRAEIIQQEAVQRAQARPGAGAEMDNATFLASLDPTLRQTVLMEQDEGFIQTLPSHMLAEVGTYREGQQAQRTSRRSIPVLGPVASRKFTTQHDAIQLLDKVGVAVLVRLLFFPHVLKKTLLFKVLVNLCENAKTRTELFNLLLNILQDGTGDLAAVDKSFAQMSFRNSKPPTSKSLGKQKAGPEYLTGLALPSSQNEAVPDLIAQRCLEALTYIVSSNEMSSLFFLTEHELPAGLRRTASKKGKGKEKQLPQTHYPIVLLLSLLDRQSLLRTPAIMESVVGLLATVTRPLASLKDRKDPVESDATRPKSPVPEPSSETPESPEAPMDTVSTVETLSTSTSDPPPAPSELTPRTAEVPTGESPIAPRKDQDLSIEAVEEKILLANTPQIPHAVLRLIVNILTVGECSGRTFQQSLALIQHLSHIPDARDIIAQELKLKAQEFGQSLSSDLDELAIALKEAQGDLLVSSVASKFSPASSIQAKLLRVLKTIDYMYSPKIPASSDPPDTPDSEDVQKVQGIYESFQFAGLWRRLGGCLAIVEEKPATEHVATVLLPLIEALMVVCKYVGAKGISSAAARALRSSASPRSPTTSRESMEELFVTFTDAHRKILNLMVRNNPSLMSGSFSLLVHNPRVLDFDNKRNYFNQQLHRRPQSREHHNTLQLNVRRARVFEDSFQYLQRKTGEQIKHGKLSVRFYDEEGVDAGGVTREWFQILARQMFDPNNALFQPCAADKLTYQPNKNSWVNPEHLTFFKFVGRVIGKAIYDGRLLDAYFARSLYRQLLGKPVDYKDVEWVDPEYYNSLCWILENDPTPLELTFSVEADEFGINRIVPLKDGGEHLPVTQENKREFVQLSAQYRLYSSINRQIESLSGGFYEIVPKDLIAIFNEQELELLISGTPDIDVDEWRAATEYNGYTSSDPNIVWWWRALKSFNRDERAKLLSFATGTSRVPLGGFVELQGVQGVQRFSIHKAYGASDRLPQAHTCFNQVDLPPYTSYEMLRQQLLLAINEGGEGFAFS